MKRYRSLALAMIMSAALSLPAIAQVTTKQPDKVEGALPAKVEQISVHSPAIEGNLMGESAERDVFVVLPPGYEDDPDKRYAVVYALHGYWIGAEQWMQEVHAPQTIEGAFAKGTPEMIVVFPTSWNRYYGSMYSSSRTTGNFEHFIAKDLVAYIDENYRTIPERESRGLVGHSMGGYGATRIGMKHADVFSALYVMSAGGGVSTGPAPLSAEAIAEIAAMTGPDDAEDISTEARSTLARAAAWSPNPNNPPLYLDLPYDGDELNEAVAAKWAANNSVTLLDQYVDQFERYAAIAIDVGDDDRAAVGARQLSEALAAYEIEHSFDLYEGDHTSELGFRLQDHVLPFFGEHLAFE